MTPLIPQYVFTDWHFGLDLTSKARPPVDSAVIDAAVRATLAERMAEFERAFFFGAVAPGFNAESFTTNAAPATPGGFNWRYWQRPMT